tara:strand:+ start:18073 stop:18291 length:219 start_codon:yes stop_codon:yes gene_type:complete
MADVATLEARLASLEEAEFQIVAGKKAVTVAYDGESVTYAATDLAQVRALMRSIRRQLGQSSRRPSARGIVT